MKNVIIADSLRTAWGKPGAGLSPFMASDYSAKLLTELLSRTGVKAAAVDQVVFGQAHPSTMPNNIGHYAWLKAELPVEVPGYTVQSCSGSALQALRSCYYLIATGNEDICVAGGADSYSAAPFVLRDVRNHFYPQHRTFIDSVEEAEQCTQPTPMTRKEQYELAHGTTMSDEALAFARQSIANAQSADNAAQILPISYEVRKKGTVTVDTDEQMADADAASPLSPYADGAAVTMLMSEEKAKELGITAKAVISGFAVAGCDPRNPQISGALAVEKLLKNKGLAMADIAVVEIIENSAQDVLDTVKTLGGSPAVNPMGGALARGKNDGAEGIAMLMRLVASLNAGQKGVLCTFTAGGQGMAALIEK
ncbi:MAG: thiolase family protein [Oscillospiraceae bacterium]|nr:thiolase family protein [Oscillospiraceae bacterium]